MDKPLCEPEKCKHHAGMWVTPAPGAESEWFCHLCWATFASKRGPSLEDFEYETVCRMLTEHQIPQEKWEDIIKEITVSREYQTPYDDEDIEDITEQIIGMETCNHEYEDHSYAGPDSGDIHLVCKKCGYDFQVILY